MQKIITMIVLFSIVSGITVTTKDVCSPCNDFRSRIDCARFQQCVWDVNQSKCSLLDQIKVSKYCTSLSDATCSQTIGCAYVQGSCTHFAGCSAYLETTTEKCLGISKRCISDGNSCIDATKCSDYGFKFCESTFDQFYQRCKWDIDQKICRNYSCSESDSTYTTDKQCQQLFSECITTGAGCVSKPLPNCSFLSGTAQTCLQMTGADGKCKFGSGNQCDLLLCSDYKNVVQIKVTDDDCKNIQTFCVKSTGKGCTTELEDCSSYQVQNNASIDCKGYFGKDGQCDGNYGGTRCRARICDDGQFTTDEACNKFKAGCITNGVSCVEQRLLCSQYDGKLALCQSYLGVDGKCKQDTDTQNCMARDCEVDGAITFSDEQCQGIQNYCVSTGEGCSKKLQSCSSYPVETCSKLIGIEGHCKQDKDGNCTAIQCNEAQKTFTNNSDCSKFQKGCVTNGTGCIPSTTCALTEKQKSCIGTQENNVYCNWNEYCVTSLSCNQFTTKLICLGSKVSNLPCFWDGVCRNAVCTDYKGPYFSNDSVCKIFPGCISNGVQCVNSSPCSNLKGTKKVCLSFKAFCTNTDSATLEDPCIERSCTDDQKLTTDSDCIQYLPDCVTTGNGCISNKAPCSSYFGSNLDCNKFYGFSSLENKRKQCWNSSSGKGQCIEKSCSDAMEMASDYQCQQFLNGCVYNGKNGCLPSSYDCSQYSGSTTSDCAAFRGNNGTKQCWWTGGLSCTTKLCSHDTVSTSNSQCSSFLIGCITKGTGCIEQTASCSEFIGTYEQCVSFGCTLLQNCASKVCSDKNDANSNLDCLNYHKKCRLQFQTQNCIYGQDQCTAYQLIGNLLDIKKNQLYCNEVTLNDNKTYCGYDPNQSNTCVTRQCSLWLNTLGVSCIDYLGKNSCRLSKIGNCYSPGLCAQYVIPVLTIDSVATIDQFTWCHNQLDNSSTPQQCTFNSNISQTNCSSISICEDIQSPQNAAVCNQALNSKYCQYTQGKCYTTKQTCADYVIPNQYNQFEFCTGLKANNSGKIILCKYDSTKSTQNCTQSTCADVSSPQSQTNCDQAAQGCKYYNGLCFTIIACGSYQIPLSIYDNQQKRQFCQNMQNINSNEYCSYLESSSTCNLPKSCNEFSGLTLAECNQFRDKNGTICTYKTGTKCEIATDVSVCLAVPGIAENKQYCDLRTTVGVCLTKSSQCSLRETNCSSYNYGSSDNLNSKATICQAYSDRNGNYCSYYDPNTTCVISKTTCNDWNSLSITNDNIMFCKSRIDKTGKQCAYDIGSTNCRTFYPCENAIHPQSQSDCDFISSGCVYQSEKCYVLSLCLNYQAIGQEYFDKIKYCSQLIDKQTNKCTYIKEMVSCFSLGECSDYSVNHLTDFQQRNEACLNIFSKNSQKCIYWTGSTCQAINTCNSYKNGQFQNICNLLQDQNGKQCLQMTNDSSSCQSTINCEYLQNAESQSDCDKFISGCLFQQGKCYTYNQCSYYLINGGGAINFCMQMKDTSGNYCTAYSDQDYNCSPRLCSDVKYATHKQCQSYLLSCKSDGIKCIDVSTPCSQQKGLPSLCEWALDTDGSSTCQSSISNFNQEPCTSRQCSQMMSSTSDIDCQKYLPSCLTNGQGCVANTEPCSKYYGNISTCKNFTGNFIKCWGKSEVIQDFCRDIQCTDLKSSVDKQCNEFIPSHDGTAICVSNGINCVQYPIRCQDYFGSQESCLKFYTIDGPCKPTSDSGLAPCTPKVCEEAPKALKTFEACQKYHPTCISDGKSCKDKKSISCEEVQTYQACKSNVACSWISLCQNPLDSCSEMTQYGPSLCVNSILSDKLTHCAWSNNTCHNYTCEDYQDQSYTTHQQCQAMDKTCTTNGEGCITMSLCSSYHEKSICQSAMSIEDSRGCTWEFSHCRQSQCRDFDGKTDEECNNLLPGQNCKSTGFHCFGSIFDCSAFNQNYFMCLTDSSGNPCLFVDGICYKYSDCTDAKGNTLQECQKFNSLCVPAGKGRCAAQTFCELYKTKVSCKIGLNNQPCGWLPTGKCITFVSCSDLVSTSESECSALNPTCITDGVKCIEMSSCASYTTKISCKNSLNGQFCIFAYPLGQNTGNPSCRDMVCSDVKGTQNDECRFSSPLCVSNGTTCINMDSCSSYKNKISCEGGGTDGFCFFIKNSQATDPQVGSCQLLTSCKYVDNITDCEKYNQSCVWMDGLCRTQSCSLQGNTCSPIYNIFQQTSIICSLVNGQCQQVDPVTFNSNDCYVLSAYTYTWNEITSKCQKCNNIQGSTTNLSTNSTEPQNRTPNVTVLGLGLFVPYFVLGVQF